MKLESRSDKAIVNTISVLLFELVAAVCGFILPRLILSHFGSSYNGITLSISQFIGVIALLKSGIGSVTRSALYKPLNRKNSYEISEVVNATKKFMRRVALIFAGALLIFAALYPFLVSNEFDWFFAFSLFIILAVDTFAQYFFGLPYQMLIQADQRSYIISIVNICSTIANTIIASILILSGFGIHVVKLGSALVFLVPPLFYMFWAKKRYHVDGSVPANDKLISQRWDAFAHQLANFINTNTDIIVITVILNLREVSVYSIYFMIGHAIKKAINSVGSGTTAAFGNMMARKEQRVLESRFRDYECLFFYVTTILVTITVVLLTSFISVYTKGVTDVNYIRETFAVLVCMSVFFMCVKVPYEQIVFAAGHFKQTRNAAFIEAGIHITASISLTYFWGLNGIVLGLVIATIYRLIVYTRYVYKNIVETPQNRIILRYMYSFLMFGGAIGLQYAFGFHIANSYSEWFVQALFTTFLIFLLGTLLSFLLFKIEMTNLYMMVRSKIIRK